MWNESSDNNGQLGTKGRSQRIKVNLRMKPKTPFSDTNHCVSMCICWALNAVNETKTRSWAIKNKRTIHLLLFIE
jgi:hypothetical protein